jgi:ABC-2 type transport system ATP-binding protein
VGVSLQVALEGVSKRFGRSVALADVSVNFEGKVNLMLGPNGSGKTTLLNVLTGLTYPEAGSLTVDGEEYRARHSEWRKGVDGLRRRSGILADKPGLPPYLDGHELLESTARSAGGDPDKGWIQQLIERLDLSSYIHSTIGGYSSGMSQKLALACSLVTKPKLVVWDEPTSNLDAKSRGAVLDLVKLMASEGSQFVISTHVSVDFENACDSLAIMNLGRVVSSGKLSDYTSASDEFEAESKDPRRLAVSLIDKGIAASVRLVSGNTVVFRALNDGTQRTTDARSLSNSTGCEVSSINRATKSIAEIMERNLRSEAELHG